VSRRRLYLPPEVLGPATSGPVVLEGERAHYLGRVLRLVPGQPLLVFDGHGGEREAEVAQVAAGRVELRLGPPRQDAPTDVEARSSASSGAAIVAPPLTLLLALCKGDVPDRVVRAVTELGVERIVPVVTRRSVVVLEGARAAHRVARWQRIAEEAARQCGRSHIPEVAPVAALAAALLHGPAATAEGGCALLVYEGPTPRPLRAALAGPPARVVALVGPEGGFAPEEVAEATSRGFDPVGLGRAVLRAETAAVTVVALVAEAYGLLG
jgi:16S rRNA (uracil1498-N3)-methyltransferase